MAATTQPSIPPAPAPVLSPPPAPADPFDKALALAKLFADQEIAAINRSNDRFFKVLGLMVTVAVVICGLFGWESLKDVERDMQSQVAVTVRTQLPPVVQQEISKQFEKKNVQQAVENILTNEVRSDLDQMVRKRAEPVVAAEMRKQQPLIESLVAANTNKIVSGMTNQIQSIAASEATRLVDNRLAFRHLSPQQLNSLSRVSSRIKNRNYVVCVVPDSEDPEELSFAQDLQAGLGGAGWVVAGPCTENKPKNLMGLAISVADTAMPPPGTMELQKLLAEIGLNARIEVGPELSYRLGKGGGSGDVTVLGGPTLFIGTR